MDAEALYRRARRQGGALGPCDAAALDASWDAVSAYARRHAWPRLHRGAVLLPGTRLDDRGEEASVLAAAGPRSVLARSNALHRAGGLDERPAVIELAVPADRQAPRIRRLETGLRPVTVARRRTLRALDVVTGDDGLRRTTVARSIAELAGGLQTNPLRLLVIDCVQRRLVTLHEIAAVLARLPKSEGRARLLRICAELREESCDSALELRTRREILAVGLRPYPRPFPWRCRDGRVVAIDIAFPEAWVAVECDGLASRLDRAKLALHHRRLEQIGRDWSLLLVDWTRISRDADGFVRELQARLAEADPSRAPAPAAR